ncbi:MAG: carbamoyltransferase HypF [Nitrospirae bacterium]|nr:carbamoyltransferase HypF [Nitrospirota bacterium]
MPRTPAQSLRVAEKTGCIFRYALRLTGAIQGVGLRPFLYRTAASLNLTGYVQNRRDGVHIEVQGPWTALHAFLETVTHHPPALCRIDTLQWNEIPPRLETTFQILKSAQEGAPLPVLPADAAVCSECLREISDPLNRRYRYPFTTCVHCGPRFSIIETLPYDRPNTTVKSFPLCSPCLAEYQDPLDRRFDAQATACPACGPRLEGFDPRGNLLATDDPVLLQAAEMILQGKIVSLKGLGGFQLLADAAQEEAVARLRLLKDRDEKPFALMFPSLEELLKVVSPTKAEIACLQSPESPIVLIKHSFRDGQKQALAQNLIQGHACIGAMLPYTPLHHLLMQKIRRPIVCTSGNRGNEPISIENQEALHDLREIADYFLCHNRPISRPMDDSVVRVVDEKRVMLRRARGYVPRPIPLSRTLPPILAAGPHLKSTAAFSMGDQAVLSQHIGNLETAKTDEAYRRIVRDYLSFYRIEPEGVACDLHPDYLSSRFAESFAQERAIPLIRVQHHHAHVAACMAENRLEGKVLGIAWDGAGYGTDGTIWGGEFLICDGPRCERIAHLRPFPLPGGERAIHEPRRSALGLVREAGLDACHLSRVFSGNELLLLDSVIRQRTYAPLTTSMGRLFDAVASLLDLHHRCTFEGQAAMALENMAAQNAADGASSHPPDDRYPCPLIDKRPWIADWGPMAAAILRDRDLGLSLTRIAFRFHQTLAELAVDVARKASLPRVTLSGGCFQNALLLSLTRRRLQEEEFEVYTHHQVPPNDGGIALGQLWVAGLSRELVKL